MERNNERFIYPTLDLLKSLFTLLLSYFLVILEYAFLHFNPRGKFVRTWLEVKATG